MDHGRINGLIKSKGREACRLSRPAYRGFLSAALSFEQPQDQQQDHRADKGVDNRADNTAADDDTERRKQPAGDQRADDTDDDIADQTEAAAFDDHSGQPAGNCADDEPDNEALCVHVFPLSLPGKSPRLLSAFLSADSSLRLCPNAVSSAGSTGAQHMENYIALQHRLRHTTAM